MWMAGFKEEQTSYEELSWWQVGSYVKKKNTLQAPTKIKQKRNSCRTLGWPTMSQPHLKKNNFFVVFFVCF